MFHGGFGGLRFGTLRYIDLFLFGVGVGIMHVQHVLYCCCIVWWLRVVFFFELGFLKLIFEGDEHFGIFFLMGWIWWFVVEKIGG